MGHSDGTVALREVENAKVLHKFTVGVEIAYLSWTTCPCKSVLRMHLTHNNDNHLYCALKCMLAGVAIC